jgi:hypothetical protein
MRAPLPQAGNAKQQGSGAQHQDQSGAAHQFCI